MIGWKLYTGRSFGDCDDWQTSACFPVLSQSALNRLHLALLHSRGLRDGNPEEACLVSGPVQMCATQTRIRLAPILLTSRHITFLTFSYSSSSPQQQGSSVFAANAEHIQGRLSETQTGERSAAKLSQLQL